MAEAKRIARKLGHVQSARSYIRGQSDSIIKTKNLLNKTKNISNYLGKIVLIGDALFSIVENLLTNKKTWLSDSLVDIGISVGIYALGCIPYVGWILAIGATIASESFRKEIEEFKDWFAAGWNEFWSFSWI